MFYISSRGSSATWWLTKVLSSHPNIVCFGATRSFPPAEVGQSYPSINSWIGPLDADKFIEGLKICETATKNQKIFGSTHGYHGIDAKTACEKFGGQFLFLTRHPVERIHSTFITTVYKNIISRDKNENLNNSDVHDYVFKILKNVDLKKYINPKNTSNKKNIIKSFIKRKFPKIFNELKNKRLYKMNKSKKNFSNEKREEVVAKIFVNTVQNFFFYDHIIMSNCNPSDGIKMEEMVKSPEYFYKNIILKIKPDEKKDENFLNKVINTSRINVHRENPLNVTQIWSSWPKNMKEIFIHYFDKYKILKLCKKFDYDTSFF